MYNAFYEEFFDMKRNLIEEDCEDDEITFGFLENVCDSFYQDKLCIQDLKLLIKKILIKHMVF